MKSHKKLSIKIAVAAIIGFLIACALPVSHNIRHCTEAVFPPGEPYIAGHCFAYEKIYANPSDLAHNKYDSLVSFSETFIVASLICLAGILIFTKIINRKHKLKGKTA